LQLNELQGLFRFWVVSIIGLEGRPGLQECGMLPPGHHSASPTLESGTREHPGRHAM
jgi:hypothetical protein